MKSSLSGSTYILLTAKSLIDTYTLPKLSNTQRENGCAGSAIRKKKHFYQRSSYFFHFLKISELLMDENALENDLYHKLAVAKMFLPTKQRPRHNPRNLR